MRFSLLLSLELEPVSEHCGGCGDLVRAPSIAGLGDESN